MTRITHYLIFAAIALLFALVARTAQANVNWTQQNGQFHKWDKTPNNKTDSSWEYALVGDLEVIKETWIKQDGVYIQCRSSGGSNRYYIEGTDCATGKLKVEIVKCDAFLCADSFGLTFDLTKNTVLTCPRVHITRDQQAQIYEGLQAGVENCK